MALISAFYCLLLCSRDRDKAAIANIGNGRPITMTMLKRKTVWECRNLQPQVSLFMNPNKKRRQIQKCSEDGMRLKIQQTLSPLL